MDTPTIDENVKAPGGAATVRENAQQRDPLPVKIRDPERIFADDDDRAFLIAEHKAMRDELNLHVGEINSVQKTALLAVGAMWAWMLTKNEWRTDYWWFAGLPALLSAMFALRHWALQDSVTKLGEYILLIETALNLPKHLGRETTIARVRPRKLGIQSILFWVLLVGGSLVLFAVHFDALTPKFVPPSTPQSRG